MVSYAICCVLIFAVLSVVRSSPLGEPSGHDRNVETVLRDIATSKLSSLSSVDCQNGDSAVVSVSMHLTLTKHVRNPNSDLNDFQSLAFSSTSPNDAKDRTLSIANSSIRYNIHYTEIPIDCNKLTSKTTSSKSDIASTFRQNQTGSAGLSIEAVTIITVASAICFFLSVFICALVYYIAKRRKDVLSKKQQERKLHLIRRHQEELEKNIERTAIGPNRMYPPVDNVGHQEDSERSGMSPEEIASLMTVVREERASEIENVFLPQESITCGREIGRGAFGKVLAGGVWKRHGGEEEYVRVAIKTLKCVVSPSDITDFLEEALVMKDINHPNIVALIGVCVEGNEPPLVCLEFMDNGDLQSFLRRSQNADLVLSDYPYLDRHPALQAAELLGYCIDIAQGMVYLAERGFVHRDLACRNCMLDKDKVVKIGDFGLARNIREDNYYRMGTERRLPAKWMALESLIDQVFTSMSDVWSFGVVMWEIFTLGKSPYPGLRNHEIRDALCTGHRLTLPEDCIAPDTYPIMASCWSRDMTQRPTFNELVIQLREYRDNFYVNIALSKRKGNAYQNINPNTSSVYTPGEAISRCVSAGSMGRSTIPIPPSDPIRSLVSLPQCPVHVMTQRGSTPVLGVGTGDDIPNPGYRFVQPLTAEGNGS